MEIYIILANGLVINKQLLNLEKFLNKFIKYLLEVGMDSLLKQIKNYMVGDSICIINLEMVYKKIC